MMIWTQLLLLGLPTFCAAVIELRLGMAGPSWQFGGANKVSYQRVTEAWVDRDERKKEKPSDHAPVGILVSE